MIILFLTNNSNTLPLSNWLSYDYGNVVVTTGVKINFDILQKLDGLRDLEMVKRPNDKICPDLIISYNYDHVIKQDVIDFMNGRIINLHISLLPFNGGFDPNFWSFMENTPKGVSIHLVDSKVDTGDILYQKELFFDEKTETLGSSYKCLNNEIQQLFKDNWKEIKDFSAVPKAQIGSGTFHYKNETDKLRKELGQKIWDIPINKLRKYYEFGILE